MTLTLVPPGTVAAAPEDARGQVLGTHRDAVCGAAFSPDGKRLATGDFEGGVKVWTLARRRAVRLSGHQDNVCGLSFDPKGRWLATGSWDGTIRLWDAAGLKSLQVMQAKAAVTDVAFSPDGALLASVDLKGGVRLWDPETGAARAERAVSPQNLNTVVFAPDGKTIAVGGQEQVIHLLDARTLEARPSWPTPGRQVFNLAFTPDGARLLSSEGAVSGRPEANDITVWTVATGKPERTLKGHQEFVYSVDVSPDGTRVASSSMDTGVRLWRMDGSLVAVLEGHTERVHQVRFAPDGKTLVSVSGQGKIRGVPGDDNSVRLWRLPD